MPPNTTNPTPAETMETVSESSVNEDFKEKREDKTKYYDDDIVPQVPSKLGPFEFQNGLLWNYIIFFAIWHSVAIYAALTFPYLTHKLTALWSK